MKNKKRTGGGKFRLPWYTAAFWLLLFLRAPSAETLLTFGSALFHEIGHLTTAFLLGVPIASVTVYPFGADIRPAPGLRSYFSDALTAGGGAAADLILALIGRRIGGDAGTYLTACNLALAGLNLLPVEGLDGGLLIRTAASALGFGSDRILKITSFFCLVGLWLAAVYILFVQDGDPSLFVLSCGLFATLFLRREKS